MEHVVKYMSQLAHHFANQIVAFKTEIVTVIKDVHQIMEHVHQINLAQM